MKSCRCGFCCLSRIVPAAYAIKSAVLVCSDDSWAHMSSCKSHHPQVLSLYPSSWYHRARRVHVLAVYDRLQIEAFNYYYLHAQPPSCDSIYLPIHPPSTVTSSPLTYALAALARNTTTPLKSSGLPHRPAGILLRMLSARFSSLISASFISVAM